MEISSQLRACFATLTTNDMGWQTRRGAVGSQKLCWRRKLNLIYSFIYMYINIYIYVYLHIDKNTEWFTRRVTMNNIDQCWKHKFLNKQHKKKQWNTIHCVTLIFRKIVLTVKFNLNDSQKKQHCMIYTLWYFELSTTVLITQF